MTHPGQPELGGLIIFMEQERGSPRICWQHRTKCELHLEWLESEIRCCLL